MSTKRKTAYLTFVEKAKKKGDWDWGDETYPRTAWVSAVVNADTQLGYFDWVIHSLEADNG